MMEASIMFDRLCEICKLIFNDQTCEYLMSNGTTPYAGETLQTTSDTLIQSAEEGCHLCNILLHSYKHRDRQIFNHFRGIKTTLLESFAHNFIDGRFMIELWSTEIGVNKSITISQISARKIENLQASRINSFYARNASSVRQIKDWITHCIKNHSYCRDLSMKAVRKRALLPSRLLDIRYVDENPHLQVRDTSDLKPGTAYVTLSHCWGQNPVISLLESNITEFQRSIPFKSLSKTFRDAIEVTRSLGYQYLWIDSLCIIQKSGDDWHRESAFIGDIYSNAILNIAATASVDGSGGLFQDSKSLALNPCRVKIKENPIEKTEFICHDNNSWNYNVENSPLARRAWVVQERMLSPRVVHFAKDQVYWECQSCRDGELSPCVNYSSEDLEFLAAGSTNPKIIYQVWEKTVRRYTQCLLTFESDKLIALAGLARRTCHQLGVEPTDYLAGIWKAEMPAGLLWRTMPHACHRKRVPERAPSWSWACINGEIMMSRTDYASEISTYVRGLKNRPGRSGKVYCQLVSADISHFGDPFGIVTGGSIILKGPLCAIKTIGPKGANSVVELSCGSLDCTDNIVSIATGSIRWDDEDACLEGMSTQVYFLLIEEFLGWCGGIVLRPMELGQGHYQRLGQIFARSPNLTELLGICRNPDLLETRRYLEGDHTYGFTIKIK